MNDNVTKLNAVYREYYSCKPDVNEINWNVYSQLTSACVKTEENIRRLFGEGRANELISWARMKARRETGGLDS